MYFQFGDKDVMGNRVKDFTCTHVQKTEKLKIFSHEVNINLYEHNNQELPTIVLNK